MTQLSSGKNSFPTGARTCVSGVSIVLMILALCGCGAGRSGSGAAAGGGNALSPPLFDFYVRQKTRVSPDRLDPMYRARLRDEFSQLEAAAALGDRNKTADTAAAIELSRLEILARAAATSAGVYADPSEAELDAAYERYVAVQPHMEYHVAHILVATESQATNDIRALDAGADFAQLAREESKDNSSANGGDLGWIKPGGLPASFLDPVMALEPRNYTRQPVHTPYGWHVVKLLEARAVAIPPRKTVRDQLVEEIKTSREFAFLSAAAARASNEVVHR